jgi:2,4-dienoyl-CoA reductase-like NADH-dependent reductase (Old Yellow Enzyme family)
MSILFEPIKIKNMELQNRFVRSATYDACTDSNGYVTENQIEVFTRLAQGGIGLIITGLAYVHQTGKHLAFQNSLVSDDYIPGLKQLTAAAHDGGAKIALQLSHAGRERAKFLTATSNEAMAPSYVPDDPYFKANHRPMSEDEIWEIIHAFGDAAQRAREAEFDAVQLHAAHAYLLSQFLSPVTNHRKDSWGGSLENRLRFHDELYRDIRAKVGEDYPVLIKIGVQDGFSGGLELDEGKHAAHLLAQWGFDALEISQGMRGKTYEEMEFHTKIDQRDLEGYFRPWWNAVKEQVNVPIMAMGGLRSFELMEEIIQRGEADFISLCRPFIREPEILNDWKQGNHHRAKCMSCNGCLEVVRKGEPLHCVQQGPKEKVS